MGNVGRVHSFETFGTVDGPGIRFVIFLQGCPLKCKYCHNRDTWDFSGGTEYCVDDIIKKIMRVKPYIDNSKGGVTVSGGEPLLQYKFVTELFKKLKTLNIHTALDTAGSLPISDDIAELLDYTDLVLLDIKHINSDKCKELVGVPNKRELEFARYLSDNNIKMWIRQVLVPGYTDDEQDLLKLKEFISSLKTVDKIQVLPYHSLGKYKWNKLKVEYLLDDVRDANQDDVDRAKSILGIL